MSLSLGADSVERELRRLSELSWVGWHEDLPFLPIQLLPQGSTPRKFEPDRFRRTTDGGAPRRELLDGDGITVVSLNEAIGIHDSLDLPIVDDINDGAPAADHAAAEPTAAEPAAAKPATAKPAAAKPAAAKPATTKPAAAKPATAKPAAAKPAAAKLAAAPLSPS
ncbi:hypothetical protein T492DRAFT_842426 [Pavlovales sp. CCMP2436]|nr:hypothetical protein T492DRAFT_842426 [Pavlovales sp. CCMP2436]